MAHCNNDKWKVEESFQLTASPGEFKYQQTGQIPKGGLK